MWLVMIEVWLIGNQCIVVCQGITNEMNEMKKLMIKKLKILMKEFLWLDIHVPMYIWNIKIIYFIFKIQNLCLSNKQNLSLRKWLFWKLKLKWLLSIVKATFCWLNHDFVINFLTSFPRCTIHNMDFLPEDIHDTQHVDHIFQ